MLMYFAHAGHEHVPEEASTNVALIAGIALVFVALLAALIVLDKKRSKKPSKSDEV